MKDKKVVALLEKPSTESFGMVGILVADNDHYVALGLTRSPNLVTKKEYNKLGGHIMPVEVRLPDSFTNPTALWLGSEFYRKAKVLNSSTLPDVDRWHRPIDSEVGWFSFQEPAKAYQQLEDWVREAAPKGMQNAEIAKMMRWTLPSHPITQAALYFTAEDKQAELQWQMRMRRDKIHPDELIAQYETIRRKVLG